MDELFERMTKLEEAEKARIRTRTVAILPARWASTRFPGKALALVRGVPVIERTYRQAKKATLVGDVIVATDDKRIFDCVEGFGGRAMMTSESCMDGTERCEECCAHLGAEIDVVVNVQGDEPLISPLAIDAAAAAVAMSSDADGVKFACTCNRLHIVEEISSRDCVKLVRDVRGNVMYASRAIIPHSKSGAIDPTETIYLRAHGLYAYKRSFLSEFTKLPTTPAQQREELEQLRAMEHGHRLRAVLVPDEAAPAPGVDRPEHVPIVEAIIERLGDPIK